jgi:NAD(P)-dependent dehydrogenase (short-subunit alcohol dehydrogenase family)
MKDPVVVITGALTGIGRATALAFANEDNSHQTRWPSLDERRLKL